MTKLIDQYNKELLQLRVDEMKKFYKEKDTSEVVINGLPAECLDKHTLIAMIGEQCKDDIYLRLEEPEKEQRKDKKLSKWLSNLRKTTNKDENI